MQRDWQMRCRAQPITAVVGIDISRSSTVCYCGRSWTTSWKLCECRSPVYSPVIDCYLDWRYRPLSKSMIIQLMSIKNLDVLFQCINVYVMRNNNYGVYSFGFTACWKAEYLRYTINDSIFIRSVFQQATRLRSRRLMRCGRSPCGIGYRVVKVYLMCF